MGVSVMEGMVKIAMTSRGQMATAVLVVLLMWAVLTKRVYVLEIGTTSLLTDLLEVVGLSEVEPVEKTQGSLEEDEEEVPLEVEEARRLSKTEEDVAMREGSLVVSRRRVPTKKIPPSEINICAGKGIRSVKTGRLDPRNGCYWSEPDSAGFRIRGPTYLMDKVKVLAGPPIFRLLECDLFDVPQPTNHMARHLKDRIDQLTVDAFGSELKTEPFVVIIQLQVPGPPWKSFVMYFAVADRDTVLSPSLETPFSRVARKFFQQSHTTYQSGDQSLHKWRNNTFKLIPRCVNAPFVVKRAVGEVPTLLGNKLQQAYFGTSSYFEVDVNIASSRIAQYTVGLALNYANVVVCDLAFLLQGASPAELPEQLVGCMRIEHIVMRDSMLLDIPADPKYAP